MSPSPMASLHLLLLLSLFTSPPSSSHASPITTIVVLVMENRSFDHMIGWMKGSNPQLNGVDGSESNPVNTTDHSSPLVYFQNHSHYVDPDPGHSFQAIRAQVFGTPTATTGPGTPPGLPPLMNGFAQQAVAEGGTNLSEAVMNGFPPSAVPVYRALVEEFAVCDRWFASVPASTQPNRLYVHSGTSHGATGNDKWLLVQGYPQDTIFDHLHDAGMSFGIYYQNIPATLFYKNLRKLKYWKKFHFYSTLKKHAQAGELPNYVVVEQRYVDSKLAPANDDHPSHDVGEGQRLVKEVYETLRASPQWNQTLLVITYDEHGGFFDHVHTPIKGVPSPDQVVGPEPFLFEFNRLGVRVPTFLISPWIEKGTVLHGPNGSPFPTSEFEHSSIPAQ
ncbi:hypothetical protein Syun_017784 [Stephania yunnanensis]|uniref:Phosphoesterase n=1 Tax=Stephania yunnanensis TaxID=152371 RepID=A0AAP0J9X9_9MAGN